MPTLPPPPLNDKPGSFTWLEWYRQLRNYIATSGSVPWYIINFAGSKIQDIADRSHNSLQGIQGSSAGEAFHITSTVYTTLQNSTQGTWTPTFTNLTEVLGGGSVVKDGRYSRIGRTIFFTITITTTGGATTASTAATTYCDLPINPAYGDTCSTVNGTTNLAIGDGVVDATNDRLYPASWTATSNTIIISGKYEV
jgi:hypothetical protein